MYCKNCGNIISSNDHVCPVCGCVAGEVVTPKKKKKNQNQTLLILVVIALIMALVVIALLIVYKMSKPQVTISNTENTAAVVQTDPSGIDPQPNNGGIPTATPVASPDRGTSVVVSATPTPTPTQVSVSCQTYVNREYGFSCAYPTEFHSITPQGVNAVKTYLSDDSSAVMTIRAAKNTNGMTLEDALDDLERQYGSAINFCLHEETWYATAVTLDDGNRSLYRKLFLKDGIICCMDFEYDVSDYGKYGPYIEYIEDHFTTKID